MYKAVIIDLDGTLLQPDGTIHPYDRDTLRCLRARGVEIGLATGRSWTRTAPYVGALGITGPVITHFGARVNDGRTGAEIGHLRIPLAAAGRLVRLALQRDCVIRFDVNGQAWFTSEPSHLGENFAEPGTVLPWPLLEARLSGEPTQVTVAGPSLTGLLETVAAQLEDGLRVLVYESGLCLINGLADKGGAILWACEYYGWSPMEVVTAGDGGHDIAMFEVCGYGLAMGRARSEVREVADSCTDADDPHGLGTALRRLFELD